MTNIWESGAAIEKLGFTASRLNRAEFLAIQEKIDKLLKKAGLKWVSWHKGSAGGWTQGHPYPVKDELVKKDAGDVDVVIDSDDLTRAMPPTDKKLTLLDSKKKLAAFFEEHGIRNTGGNLNLAVPIGDKHVQVDIFVNKDAANVIHGHTLDYSLDPGMRGSDLWGRPGEGVKGVWHILVNMTPSPSGSTSWKDPKSGEEKGALQLSPELGIVDRASGNVVLSWGRKDQIARMMIGPKATAKEISSLTGIKKALSQAVQDNVPLAVEKYNAVKEYLPKDKVQEGNSDWFRRVLNIIP